MKKVNDEILEKIEDYSRSIDIHVGHIIDQYCAELDNYMRTVDESLRDEKNFTDEELDDIALNLSSLIYFTSVGCEDLGIRDDISKTIYKEAYNKARSNLTTGTVADKNVQAELDAIEEHVGNVVYNKAYKKLKAKIEASQDMLATVKKIMTRRVAELELSRIQVSK